METLNKIYRYEVDLYPRPVPKKDPYVIFALTESLEIAERVLRMEYPSLLMYSISAVKRFTIVADKCSDEDLLFNVDIIAGHVSKVEVGVLIISHSLAEAFKICFERYNYLGIKEINMVKMDGVILPRGTIGIEG